MSTTDSARPEHNSSSVPLAASAIETVSPLIARQPIVDRQRSVYAYELYDRSTAHNAFNASSDAALLFNALSYVGKDALVDKHPVFLNCTQASLEGSHLELVHPGKVVLEVPVLPFDATQEEIDARVPLFESLRERGFRLAFDQYVLRPSYSNWLPTAAFIKLDMKIVQPEMAPNLIQFARIHTQAQIIAEKVETAEQFDLMESLGVQLFQGFWLSLPSLVKVESMRPSQIATIQLINLIRKEASTDEIEMVLKKDPSLSFHLLRFINSSGLGLSCEVTSFRHAVMILGLQKLLRWAVLLMTTSSNSKEQQTIGRTAVLRGRLMELLAIEMLSPDDADNAFVVGVFSLLDSMLSMPLDKALESVSLPEPVIDALLHNTGVYAPFLALAKSCENADDASFAKNASALHLSNHQVNWAHLQALAWAEDLNAALT